MLKEGDCIAIYAYQDDANAWLLYGTFTGKGKVPVVKMDRGGEIPITDEWLEPIILMSILEFKFYQSGKQKSSFLG